MSTPLDSLLGQWADAQRLTAAQSDFVRARVLAEAASAEEDMDVDWLRDLLRPVTALLDGPHGLHEMLSRGYARSL
jgi:hypothetical protein